MSAVLGLRSGSRTALFACCGAHALRQRSAQLA